MLEELRKGWLNLLQLLLEEPQCIVSILCQIDVTDEIPSSLQILLHLVDIVEVEIGLCTGEDETRAFT